MPNPARFQEPDILYENERWMAVNKPAGMLSIPDREGKEDSLKSWLQQRYEKIFTLHRLDRETSGLILFAKDEETHRFLSQAFESRSVSKTYLGIVQGRIPAKSGIIEEPIHEHPSRKGIMVIGRKGKPAVTEYRVLEDFGSLHFLEIRILTGKTHQIRVHMQYLGHPIACDTLYGNGGPLLLSSFKRNYKISHSGEAEKPLLNRLALHSWRLSFIDPAGNSFSLEAPLPKDMKAVLQQLRKISGTG